MAKRKGCGGCCLIPVILIVVIIVGIFGVYAFLPFASTLGIANQEILAGETFESLGISDYSVRKLLKTKIGELGNGKLANIEIIDGVTPNALGLDSVSLSDVFTKKIKDLGNLNNYELVAGSGMTLHNMGLDEVRFRDFTYKKIESLGDLQNYDFSVLIKKMFEDQDGQPSQPQGDEFDINKMLQSVSGLTLKNIGLSSCTMLDIVNKPISELGDFGTFNFLSLFSELPFDDGEVSLKIGSIQFTDGSVASSLNLIKFAGKLQEIDYAVLMNDVVGDALAGKDLDEVENQVIDEKFENFDQETELSAANDVIENIIDTSDSDTFPTVNGESIVSTDDDGNIVIDYSKIFEDKVEFSSRELITLKDTELTAIFNSLIKGDDEAYKMLRDSNAVIRQVVITKNANGSVNVKMTLNIDSALFASDVADALNGMTLPATLYITCEFTVAADSNGVVTHTDKSLSIDNYSKSMSDFILSMTGIKGEISAQVGNLFTTFINNFGSVGLAEDNLGNVGLDSHTINILTHSK